MLSVALWLVHERGLSVIPLDHPGDTTQTDPARIGKAPVSGWKLFQTARPTDDNLRSWFGNGRRCNMGIVCGPVIAVDLDSAEAITWADAHLSPTQMATKTAKGEHRFFRNPGDAEIRNRVRLRTGDPAIKIDLREGRLHRRAAERPCERRRLRTDRFVAANRGAAGLRS